MGALLLGCVVLAACAAPVTHRMYDGSVRPPAEIATLEEQGVTLVQIDGRMPCDRMKSVRCNYELLPGAHAVSAHVDTASGHHSRQPQSAAFVAEAGRVYWAKYELASAPDGKRLWLLLIVDATTGKSVQTNW